MRVDVDESGLITTIAVSEIIIDLFLCLDFALKAVLRSFFMDPGFYGLAFCLLDFIAGPAALAFDFVNLAVYREFGFEGYMLRTAKVLTLEFSRCFNSFPINSPPFS